jgi:uncharacterized protein YndB with AHSA1/START domain
MTSNSYTATIEVERSPSEVFSHLTRDVSKWWGGKDLEGRSQDLNDEFTVHHPGAHFSRQRLVEVVPDQKIVWLVTEATLHWLKGDKHEWTNTKMIFEISTRNDKTVIRFTHEGLVPRKECYARCEQGWNMVIEDWLANFIADGSVARQLRETELDAANGSRFVYVTIIRTTPGALWEALTTPAVIRKYWFDTVTECDWKKGSPWRTLRPDGTVMDAGEILEIDPHRRMAIRWQNEWRPDFKSEGPSRCTYELEPVDHAVKLTVTHEHELADSKLIGAVSAAWPLTLSNLKSLLETGEVATSSHPGH